jgi:mRNA-degrading endonuclease toxin of MazEF toxin-antitoxin module
MPYKRGEVVLALFPYADLKGVKNRHALVLQDEDVATGFDQQIIAQLTSNVARKGPTRVRVNLASVAGQQMGLLPDSVVVTDKLATVESKVIDKAIGTCPCLDRVDRALGETLRLSVRRYL